MPPSDAMTPTQQNPMSERRRRYAATVSALAEKELIALFGSDVGRQAAQRVAVAFRAAASTAKNPDDFYSCSPESVAACMATSAFTGIMPGGPFPGCYLIPKRVNGVQQLNWWINHRGIKVLARRAGQGIEAMPYFEGDEVVIVRGKDWRVDVLEGDADRSDPRNLAGVVYYVTDLTTGALLAARKVSRRQIDARKAKGQGGAVWGDWYAEMAEKTAIKFAAGRGDVFFDDVGNMALARDADNEPEAETTTVRPATRDPLDALRGATQQALPDHGDRGTVIDAEPERVTSDTTTTTDDEAP